MIDTDSLLKNAFPDCPDASLLRAAQAGVLPLEIYEKVTQHIGICAACTILAADLEELDMQPMDARTQAKIKGRIEKAVQPAQSHPLWRPPFLVPIMLATVGLIAGILLWPRTAKSPLPPADAKLSKVAPGVQTPSSFVLIKPPIILPAQAVIIWRGKSDNRDSYDALSNALKPYRTDDFEQSARLLRPLTKQHPELAEAHFYLGISYLFLHRPEDAAIEMESIQGAAVPRQLQSRSRWFLAVAYHESGKDAQARSLLEPLCASATQDSAEACTALREIAVVP